jgi:hypothetical protein
MYKDRFCGFYSLINEFEDGLGSFIFRVSWIKKDLHEKKG